MQKRSKFTGDAPMHKFDFNKAAWQKFLHKSALLGVSTSLDFD